MEIDSVVFKAGTLHDFSHYVAGILSFDELDLRRKIKSVYGISSGALAALYAACCISGVDMLTDYLDLFPDTMISMDAELASFAIGNESSYGVNLQRLLSAFFDKHVGVGEEFIQQLSLGRLFEITGIRLCCICCSSKLDGALTHEKHTNPLTLLTPEEHGEMSVYKAVMASMAIPGLVEAVDDLYDAAPLQPLAMTLIYKDIQTCQHSNVCEIETRTPFYSLWGWYSQRQRQFTLFRPLHTILGYMSQMAKCNDTPAQPDHIARHVFPATHLDSDIYTTGDTHTSERTSTSDHVSGTHNTNTVLRRCTFNTDYRQRLLAVNSQYSTNLPIFNCPT